ncbi:hypothetical protein HPB48_011516 [Haemaphysalis longicornis]|uniref:Uncharacterized protein n=1 Tax=Haemaphysalis longicornis TaxID=44386 RepID=A0A9J6FTU3_HAELO|nr:hypothetical protein HPB48_011516 [Haemaphysalis longicornis]
MEAWLLGQTVVLYGARKPRPQDVGNLQHLISNSTSTSESSEDDIESNTSKHSVHHASSNDSMQTSQPCGGGTSAGTKALSCSGCVGSAVVTCGSMADKAAGNHPLSTAGDSGYCQSGLHQLIQQQPFVLAPRQGGTEQRPVDIQRTCQRRQHVFFQRPIIIVGRRRSGQ